MIICGDCLEKLKEMEENSIDAVVSDPPYGLSFMGKKWDYDVPSVEIWKECLRVLKPGGYLLSFAGTRTQHRMAVNIEDAGFEIRDMIAWVYGSGFPKSLNIGKAVDKLQGNEREDLGEAPKLGGRTGKNPYQSEDDNFNGYKNKDRITKGTSEWEGWGTALKPALEPITVARKPLSEKTVAKNCLRWGTGGLNIDGSRVEGKLDGDPHRFTRAYSQGDGHEGWKRPSHETNKPPIVRSEGRFPANLIHDGSDEVVELFPDTKSGKPQGVRNTDGGYGKKYGSIPVTGFGDNGSASRFFYCAKASKKERNMGCEGLEEKELLTHGAVNPDTTGNSNNTTGQKPAKSQNNHPTVKPIALMEYLIKLVSREGATVLDPFMGSGSTGIACKNLKREFIGIEMDEEYCKIAKARISAVNKLL